MLDFEGVPFNSGRSNTWRVDLSEVTASWVLDGEIAREKMSAGSTPRRNSVILAQLLVEKTRMSVPWGRVSHINRDVCKDVFPPFHLQSPIKSRPSSTSWLSRENYEPV